MTTLYCDVQEGEAAPLDDMYLQNADAMIIDLYDGKQITYQIRVRRLRGTRRVGNIQDIMSMDVEENVLIEDVEIWSRTPDPDFPARGVVWERLGIETRKIPVNEEQQRLFAAFDAANVLGE